MAVDPVQRNHVSVKPWAATMPTCLYLYVPLNGADFQVDCRHAGGYMPLSVVSGKPPLLGRFFQSTTLRPVAVPQGKA